MLLVGQTLIFLAAVAGVAFFSLFALRFIGAALNPNRKPRARAAQAAAALACAAGIVASGAGGFYGVGALLYISQR
ncbi:MAG: hypothetical protein GC206_09370 [Alphaproteobacteria bacterium]|nr:hypothetical protein [Alphaproteobacteria bacterium]